MTLKFLAPYWGYEHLSPNEFINMVVQEGYHGIELHLPPGDENKRIDFFNAVNEQKHRDPDFIWVLQHITPYQQEDFEEYVNKDLQNLHLLISCRPDFINAHTGKDFFSFAENCRIIHEYEKLTFTEGIDIFHETHRGTFSFHLATLVHYLDEFPDLKLTADFSHFCVVSESMLEGQEKGIDKIIPNVKHLHARVGFSQSPQVNHPFAKEWSSHLEKYLQWWNRILSHQISIGNFFFTITPEFGPFPYMPVEPFTQKPLASQWKVNLDMKHYLQTHLKKSE